MVAHTVILPFAELTSDQRARAGGKALAPARMAREDLRVPDGICLLTDAYTAFTAESGMAERIGLELSRKRFEDMRWEELWDTALRIRTAASGEAGELGPQGVVGLLEPVIERDLRGVRTETDHRVAAPEHHLYHGFGGHIAEAGRIRDPRPGDSLQRVGQTSRPGDINDHIAFFQRPQRGFGHQGDVDGMPQPTTLLAMMRQGLLSKPAPPARFIGRHEPWSVGREDHVALVVGLQIDDRRAI